MPWYVLSCMWDRAYKITLTVNPKRVAQVMAAAGFLSGYVRGPLQYIQRHITVKQSVEYIVK